MNKVINPTEFFGTKRIQSWPMNRAQYNAYRGWQLPDDEDGSDEGYLVEYMDGGKTNDERHDGYISWSPKEVFENAYQPSTAMSYGHALVAMKEGCKVARSGWNGKGMFVFWNPGPGTVTPHPDSVYAKHVGTEPIEVLGHFDMRTADGSICVGWLASQTDMSANDWCVVD